MNHGRAVLDGHAPWVKIALNYLTPFVVASLGYLEPEAYRELSELCVETSKVLAGLLRALRPQGEGHL